MAYDPFGRVSGVQAIHAGWWEFKAELGDAWPTPSTYDSLAFAGTEAGEVLDAVLRQNSTYKRNHERPADVLGELADCAFMCMTALGPAWTYRDEPPAVLIELACGPHFPAYLFKEVGLALASYATDRDAPAWLVDAWRYHAENAVLLIALHPPMALGAEIEKRKAQLRQKWAPQPR